MQQVTRTLSDIPWTLPGCQVQVLLPIKINYSCQNCLFKVKSPKRKFLNAFTSEHQCRNAQEHLGTTDLRIMFPALQEPAEHFVGWRKTFLSGQKNKLTLGMLCGLGSRQTMGKKKLLQGTERKSHFHIPAPQTNEEKEKNTKTGLSLIPCTLRTGWFIPEPPGSHPQPSQGFSPQISTANLQ